MGDSLCTNDHNQQIVEKYADMLFRIAISHLSSRHDAEDIVQSVFLQYIEKQPAFDDIEHEKAWFIRVSINMCKNHLHTAWFRRIVELDEEMGYPVFEKDEIDGQNIINAVMKLLVKYRLVIYLFYYEDYSTQQIAKMTGAREATVRSQMFRARRMLKASLKEAFIDE